jgi:hypothetical protein
MQLYAKYKTTVKFIFEHIDSTVYQLYYRPIVLIIGFGEAFLKSFNIGSISIQMFSISL